MKLLRSSIPIKSVYIVYSKDDCEDIIININGFIWSLSVWCFLGQDTDVIEEYE